MEKNIFRLVYILAEFLFPTSEREIDFYHENNIFWELPDE